MKTLNEIITELSKVKETLSMVTKERDVKMLEEYQSELLEKYNEIKNK